MPILLHYKTERHEDLLQELLAGARLDKIILVVPTKRRIRHLSREILSHAFRGVSPALPIFTLDLLAGSLYTAWSGARTIVGGTVQTLLFDTALRRTRDSLEYFRLKGRDQRLYQGTFDKVIDVITTLKESGISPELLRDEAAKAPPEERQKLVDVAAIYEAYDEQLATAEAEDRGGVFRFFDAACSQHGFELLFRAVYPSAQRISLAGFDEFTPPEIGFIHKLCKVSGVSVSLLFDFQHGNPALFGHLEDNYARFLELGFREDRRPDAGSATLLSVAASRRPAASQEAVRHLGRSLFLRPEGDMPPRANLRASVTLIRARNRVHEVELICKLVKKLVAESPGRDLSTICVAMIRPQVYADIVREQFQRFGIPVNVTDRYELDRSPLVVAVMGVLQMVVNGFRRDDVLRIVSSPFFPFTTGPEAVNVPNLIDVSRRLRIVAGLRSWREKIDHRLGMLGHLARGRKAVEQEGDSLHQALRDIDHIHRETAVFPGAMAPADFLRVLKDLLHSLGVASRIVTRASPDYRERDARALAKFLEVAKEVVDLLALREGSATRNSLRHYTEQLRLAVSRERYNVREQFGQGVLVTSVDETRGLSMDVMIVAGLVDGEFPSMYQPEVFLSAHRRKLREQRHNWQHRYLFYQAATNWSDHLYLTYPERDGEVDLVPSSFVDALLKVADVEMWESREAYPLAEALCTEDEVIRWCLDHGAGGEGVVARLPEDLTATLTELRRLMRIERSRVEDHILPEHEGHGVGGTSEKVGRFLAAMRTRTFSATQLETYGICPFRFFVEWVLSLGVTEDFREELTPLEKGNFLHDALYEFFLDRRERNLPPLPRCNDQEFEEAARELTAIVEGRLGTLDLPDAFWHLDRGMILGGQGYGEGLLRRFLTLERERQVAAVPSYFEVAFGGAPEHHDPLLSSVDPVTLGSLRFRGKIDRVDVGEGFFLIIDYKTGSVLPGAEEIRTGVSMQLPLYLHAVEELLERVGRGGSSPAGGIYYQLRDPIKVRIALGDATYKGQAFDPGERSRSLSPDASGLRSIIETARAVAEQHVEGICRGEFPLTKRAIEKTCIFCPYKTICRIQTLRRVRSQDSEAA